MRNLKFLKVFNAYVSCISSLLERCATQKIWWEIPFFGLLKLGCICLLLIKIASFLPQKIAVAEEKTAPEPAKKVEKALTSSPAQKLAEKTPEKTTPKTGGVPAKEAEKSKGDVMAASSSKVNFDPMQLTSKEIQVLESLSVRRQELEEKDKKITLRMALLQASEQRIDQKIDRLQSLKGAIESLLKKYDVQENENFKAVAKIYDKMNPKEAARILGSLEMPILLNVMSYMKDAKTSQVISFMETDRAKDLTLALARERRLKNVTQNALNEATPASVATP